MTAHDHRTYVDGCYRCELSRDEATTTPADIIEQALRIATDDVQHLGGVVLEALDAAGYQIVPKAERPSVCPTCGSDDRDWVVDCTDPVDSWHGGAE